MKVIKKETPYAVFGTWEVWKDGTLKSVYVNPSGRESTINIYPEMLAEPDLLLNLHADRTVKDWNDFIEAFFTACEVSKIKNIKNFQTGFE